MWLGCRRLIQEYHTCFDTTSDRFEFFDIISIHTPTESEIRTIRHFDRLIETCDADNRSHRAEDLFPIRCHLGSDICEYGRCVEKSGSIEFFSTREASSSFGNRFLYLGMNLIDEIRTSEGPEIGQWIHRIANNQGFGMTNKCLTERIIVSIEYEESFR